MKISKNFDLSEFLKSQTSDRLGIDNTPSETTIENLKLLAEKVLQPVRDHFGAVVINSGYRSVALNKAIGGVATSQHCKGQAADIEVPNVSNSDVALWIKNNLVFDQLILEFYTQGQPYSGWVHVSYNPSGPQRKQVLTAAKQGNKTVYLEGLQK